jgi:hypothetical protein
MALSEELEEYLATRVSPKARGLLRKAALKMPEDRRAGFLASLQQADFEFQVPIQDRMPEGAENVDPGRFRHHDYGSEIPYSALNRSMDLNTTGQYVPPRWGKIPEGASQEAQDFIKKYNPSEQQVSTPYGDYSFPLEPDTVNTYGLGNTPVTIAHEYRHRQDLEGLPKKGNRFDGSEYLNKVQDLLGATNENELREGLLLTAYTFRETMVTDGGARSFAVEIGNLARDPDTPLEELAEGARFFLNHPMTKNLMHASTMRSDKAGEDAPFKDTISPDDFRRSDFYKTDIKEQSWLDKLKGAMRK